MNQYEIVYTASNVYSQNLSEAFLEYQILPCEDQTQRLVQYTIETEPSFCINTARNLYGMKCFQFSIRRMIPNFNLTMRAVVEKLPINPFDFIPLSVAEENQIMQTSSYQLQQYFYLQQTDYTRASGQQPAIHRIEDETVFDFAQRVNSFVYGYIAYDLSHASIQNSIDTILSNRKGVCQDYAHLMISILRNNGIAARYVSGYLHQGHGYEGDNAIHAWVEVLIPGITWLGFDPTNNLLANEFYIKIAHGVDLNECQSLRGVIRSAGISQTNYGVQVNKYEQSIQSNQ